MRRKENHNHKKRSEKLINKTDKRNYAKGKRGGIRL